MASKLKFIFLLREPAERLHDAFWHYDHYQKHFGASEDGFDQFATEMTNHFEVCESEQCPRWIARDDLKPTILNLKPCSIPRRPAH